MRAFRARKQRDLWQSSEPRGADRRSDFFRYYLPPILYGGLIFYLSSRSFENVDLTHGLDKGVHLIIYAGLGYLVLRALHRLEQRPRIYLWMVCIVFLYGLSDELHQRFVPGRTFEILDLLVDGLGGVIAGVVCRLAEGLRRPVWF